MLSDTEIAQLEAELEQDLEQASRVSNGDIRRGTQAESHDDQQELKLSDDELVQLEAELEQDAVSDDELHQLPGFELFAISATSIESLVQDVKEILVDVAEGETFQSEINRPDSPTKVVDQDDRQEEVLPVSKRVDFSVGQDGSQKEVLHDHPQLNMYPAFEEALPTTHASNINSTFDLPETVLSTHVTQSLEAGDSDADINTEDEVDLFILDHAPSDIDVLLHEAMYEANEHVRITKENGSLQLRMELVQRCKIIRSNLNAKIIQKWFCRAIKIRRDVFSFTQSATRTTVQGTMETGLCQVIGAKANIFDQSIVSQEFPNDRALYLHCNCWKIVHENHYNYQYIFVKRDLIQHRIHVSILSRRQLMHFVVYPTKKLSNTDVYIDRRRLLQEVFGSHCRLSYLQRNVTIFRKQDMFFPLFHYIHALSKVTPPLLTVSSQRCQPSRMLLDVSDSSLQDRNAQSCSDLGRIIRRVLRRVIAWHAFDILRRWKAVAIIQRSYRGFVIRRRMESMRIHKFSYVDSELDSILSHNIRDLIHFDEMESDLDWKPCRPDIPTIYPSAQHSSYYANENVNMDTSVMQNEASASHNELPHRSETRKMSKKREDTPPAIHPRSEIQLVYANAMIQKNRQMKMKGSNGIALRLRR